MKFIPNFASVSNDRCILVHYSTSSTIELTILADPLDPETKEQRIWMDYTDLDALIDVIKKVERI
jgi:hypothetical protein